MAKLNTRTIRAHPKFEELVKKTLEKKSRKVTTSRITLAMYNQYMQNPRLLKQLMESDLR